MLCCLLVTQMSTKEKEAELRAMQEKYGVDGALSLPLSSLQMVPMTALCALHMLG